MLARGRRIAGAGFQDVGSWGQARKAEFAGAKTAWPAERIHCTRATDAVDIPEDVPVLSCLMYAADEVKSTLYATIAVAKVTPEAPFVYRT